MSRGTHVNESCQTYGWDVSHVRMGHVTHMHGSCHTCEWVMSHICSSRVTTHMNKSCHTYECIMSHAWRHTYRINIVSHVTDMNESCHTYERVMSCHTYECIMSHVWRHTYRINIVSCHTLHQSCHSHEWIFPHINHIWMCHVTHDEWNRTIYLTNNESCHRHESVTSPSWMNRITHTGWRRPIGRLNLQIIFRKRATNYWALLRKMTYKNKASYGSSLPCMDQTWMHRVTCHMSNRTHTFWHDSFICVTWLIHVCVPWCISEIATILQQSGEDASDALSLKVIFCKRDL